MDQKWPYSERYLPRAPVIRLELEGSAQECLVDTGFAGGVLIPFPVFESLGFASNLGRDEYVAVMPDNRRLPLFTSRGRARVGQTQVGTDVHSSPELNRSLVGRSFLKRLVAVLDGFDETFSVTDSRRAPSP